MSDETTKVVHNCREIDELVHRLQDKITELLKTRGFDRNCADALADEVAILVRTKAIDARSPAADALLDYRVPPFTSRSDRMARLCAEREQLRQQLLAARAKAIDEVISHGRRTGLILEIDHQVLEALRLGVCPKPEVHDAKDEDLRP